MSGGGGKNKNVETVSEPWEPWRRYWRDVGGFGRIDYPYTQMTDPMQILGPGDIPEWGAGLEQGGRYLQDIMPFTMLPQQYMGDIAGQGRAGGIDYASGLREIMNSVNPEVRQSLENLLNPTTPSQEDFMTGYGQFLNVAQGDLGRRLGQIGEQYKENILPGVYRRYGVSGQPGSSREALAVGEALEGYEEQMRLGSQSMRDLASQTLMPAYQAYLGSDQMARQRQMQTALGLTDITAQQQAIQEQMGLSYEELNEAQRQALTSEAMTAGGMWPQMMMFPYQTSELYADIGRERADIGQEQISQDYYFPWERLNYWLGAAGWPGLGSGLGVSEAKR